MYIHQTRQELKKIEALVDSAELSKAEAERMKRALRSSDILLREFDTSSRIDKRSQVIGFLRHLRDLFILSDKYREQPPKNRSKILYKCIEEEKTFIKNRLEAVLIWVGSPEKPNRIDGK